MALPLASVLNFSMRLCRFGLALLELSAVPSAFEDLAERPPEVDAESGGVFRLNKLITLGLDEKELASSFADS